METIAEHAKRRLIDILWVSSVALIFWAVYTGYVLMGTVNSFYKGQCQLVQDQALEQAVQEELQRRAEVEGVKE